MQLYNKHLSKIFTYLISLIGILILLVSNYTNYVIYKLSNHSIDNLHKIQSTGLWLILCPLMSFILNKLDLVRSVKILFYICLAFICFHYYFSSASDYMYDVEAHKDLIRYYSKNWWPQPIGDSWLSYHPPLYYYLSALFYKLEQILQLKEFTLVRFFSVILNICFITIGLAIINKISKNTFNTFLISSFICLFPLNDINSVKINNDVLLYPIWAISIYYLISIKENPNNFRRMILTIAVGLITKSNAILMSISLLAYLIFDLGLKYQYKNLFKKNVLSFVFLVFCFILSTGRVMYYQYSKGSSANLLVANYKESIENEEGKLIQIRLPNLFESTFLINPPFPETFELFSPGKLYPLHLIKTFLYGEGFRKGEIAAKFINVSFVFGLLIAILYLITIPIKRFIPELALITIPLLGHLANTFTKPVICTADARYIFPILIPISMFFIKLLSSINKKIIITYIFRYLLILDLITLSISAFVFHIFQHLV